MSRSRPLTAEIVSVGTELLMGQITNTDAQYLARRLSEAGVTLHHQSTVGDNPGRLLAALQTALTRADIVITTGGLGPTADDITKELSARALSLSMERRPEAEAMVRAWFVKSGRRHMTENNLRQSEFPQGAAILANRHGTAPGCITESAGKAIINLPGPPRELMPMFEGGVLPYLMARSGAHIVSRYLRIFGMGESQVESLTHDLMETMENPTLAPYCSLGEVQLRMTVRVGDPAQAPPLLDALEGKVRARIGGVIYAVTDRPDYRMEEAVAEALLKNRLTIATAESCTGGMLASRLVNVPGISGAFLEGHIPYANAAKVRALGVSEETLAACGAVSPQTAREMAQGLRHLSGADLALSTTGIAGPEGGTDEKPVGLVYLGLATAEGAYVKTLRLTGDRDRIRILATLNALYWLLQAANGQPKAFADTL